MTPIESRFVVTASVFDFVALEFLTLDVSEIVVSQDVDRFTECEATLILASVTDQQWRALDPRLALLASKVPAPPVEWKLRQYTLPEDVEVFALPAAADPATMYVRSVRRDWILGTVEVELAAGESILEERRRNASNSLDTGATNVHELIEYSLFDTFGGYTLSDDLPLVAIPAGDRRMFNPGESHIDLIRPELDAINCRLSNLWGFEWYAGPRETTGDVIKLATFTQEDGADADVDPIVSEIVEEVSRDSGWYDGILIKYDNTDNGGSVTWSRSGDGDNSRSLFLTFDRAAPGAGSAPADAIQARAFQRGHDIILEAACSLEVVPGRPLEVHTRAGILFDLTIRSVEWSPVQGTMRIRAQTGDPVT